MCYYNGKRQVIGDFGDIDAKFTELETKRDRESETIDSVKQYGHRQNLEIVEVPIKEIENTNEIAIEVEKLLNVTIALEQISTSHRLLLETKIR